MDFIVFTIMISFWTCKGLLLSYHILGFKYPSSVYLNIALLYPLFMFYKDLIGGSKAKDAASIKITALMLLTDILIDEFKTDNNTLLELFEKNTQVDSLNSIEKITKNLFSDISYEIDKKNYSIIKVLHRVQLEPNTDSTPKSLEKIARGKGLWFPALIFPFNPKISNYEIKVLQDFGFLMKCIDDSVDIEEDNKNGQKTIFTELESNPQEYIMRLEELVIRNSAKLNYATTKKKKFIVNILRATESFKLHNELINRMPKIYGRLLKVYQPLMLTNLIISNLIGLKKLIDKNVRI